MGVREWVAVVIGVCGITTPAVSASPPARRIEATADAAQLTEVLLPTEADREWLICNGDCPPGVGRVQVTDPAVALVGSVVQARGKVHTEVMVIGAVSADVVCTVVPDLREGGQVHVRGLGCRIEGLTGGISSWLRRGVTATLEPALGVLLEEQLRAAPPYDLLTAARQGWLASYSTDPALGAPGSSDCVRAVRSVSVREGQPSVLVVGLDVACGG